MSVQAGVYQAGLRVCSPQGFPGQRAPGWVVLFGVALSSDPIVVCAGGPGSPLPCPVCGFPGSREPPLAVGCVAAAPFSHFSLVLSYPAVGEVRT